MGQKHRQRRIEREIAGQKRRKVISAEPARLAKAVQELADVFKRWGCASRDMQITLDRIRPHL
jgi:hypothetical protein